MGSRKRTLTDADRKAAAKLRALWTEYQKRNPGVSQETAAARAGMGQSAFSQFLRGTVPMRVAPVITFAKLFEVDPREIREDLELVYSGRAKPTSVPTVRDGAAPPYAVSEEALEIAKAFDKLQPQARAFIREQVFIYAVIDRSFPWLRHGRPTGKSYDQFEKKHIENINAQRDLHAQQVGLLPREKAKAKPKH